METSAQDAGAAESVCAGDPVAARLALQRVFPGLVNRASHRVRLHHGPMDEVLEELISTAWLVFTQFPLERRPVKIAVNIPRDTEHMLDGYVPKTARRTIPVLVEDLPHLPAAVTSPRTSHGADPQDRPGEVPRMLLDAVEEGFPADDARLLAQMFIFDQTIAEIAVQEGLSARVIRAPRKKRNRGRIERWEPGSGTSTADESRDGGPENHPS